MGILKWDYQLHLVVNWKESPQCNSCEFRFIQALAGDYSSGNRAEELVQWGNGGGKAIYELFAGGRGLY